MKKGLTLGLCALLLVGCSSQFTTKVSDNTKLINADSFSFEKQDFYEYLLDNYGADQVLNLVLSQIADKEVTDEKAINDLLAERVKIYDSYSDGGIEEYAKSMGYTTADEYKSNVLLPDVKQELLREQYIKDNYDSLMEEYQVCSLKQIVFEKESTALSAIEKAVDEDAFDELMDAYGSEKAQKLGVVTKNSSLDENLISKLGDFVKLDKDGVYSEAIALSDDTYAIIFVYNTDKEANKDDYLDSLSAESTIITKAEGYYLDKYHFNVNEKKLKEAIKDLSSEYIK